MTKIKIQVTAEDIARGVRKTCSACPVALATVRALAHTEKQFASVTPHHLWYDVDQHVELPAFVRAHIRMFDSLGQMEPFEFDLELR